MSFNSPYLGTKQTSYTDQSKSDIPVPAGIYVGLVKRVDSNTRSGRLLVYIDKFGGNNPDDSTQWKVVSYASPYSGTTIGAAAKNNPYSDLKATNADNTFLKTQQSYGFFMTPPDVGNQVLCCFVTNSVEGFWFACVNTNLSRNMLPAIGSVPWNKISDVSVQSAGIPNLRPGYAYPVAETNEALPELYAAGYLPDVPKPLHVPQTIRLIIQGLDTDPIRGAIDSSIQRDPVSNVFGFSTPGRPYGPQDPANSPTLQDKLRSGNFNPEEFTVTTRVGGHSLVMDDGDIYNKSNLVRLKTSAGHQIMMNDSEGFVYIANSTGSAWIELTKEGDILVYGKRDLSIRTQGNLMMHSDKSINFYAKGAVNIAAGSAVKMQSQVIQANAEKVLNLFGQQAQLKSQSQLGLIAGSNMSIKAGAAMSLNGSTIALNGGGGGGDVSPPGAISTYQLPDAIQQNGLWSAQPSSLTSINYKVPTHEPYARTKVTATGSAATTTTVDGAPISPTVSPAPKNVDLTSIVGVRNPAPVSSFITQPTPAAGIGVLDQQDLRAYMAQLGYSENGSKYTGANTLGYQGKYQMGSQALQDLGYVKAGTPQSVDALNNPNNWTGKNGITSATAFQNTPSVQEDAMYTYTRSNYATLESKGVITSATSKEDVAGLLSAAHLAGAGGTANWYTTGKTFSDAYGTSIETYFNQGKYSITQVPVISASDASKGKIG